MLEKLAQLPILGPVVGVWLQILFLVVGAVLDAEIRLGQGKGAEKKAMAIASIDAQIDAPGGPEWPAWMPPATQPVVIGFVLELFLFAANRLGFSNGSKAIEGLLADWLRKHLPPRIELPPDSFKFASDHWVNTKARGRVVADPMDGTRWEHVEPGQTEVTGNDPLPDPEDLIKKILPGQG